MTQRSDERIRRSYDAPSDVFLTALERAIEIAPKAEDVIDVVLWNKHECVHLGTFSDYSTAGRHRQAVIDAVMSTRRRAVAA